MKQESSALPRWDLDPIYQGFDDPSYENDIARLKETISQLEEKVNNPEETAKDPEAWTRSCIDLFNGASEVMETLESFTACRYTTATTDREVVGRMNLIEELAVPLSSVRARFRETLASIEKAPEELCHAGSPLAEYRFFLEEELHYRKLQLTAAEEDLAADLARPGAVAWGRLQETLSSTESAVWDEGTGERKTLVQLRTLAYDADRTVRERAYRKELGTWKGIEIPMAFALNGVKGFSVILNGRRGHRDTLERSAMQNRISGKALDAMISVMQDSLPLFRSYLKTKARLLGLERCAFFDLFAPLKGNEETWDFDTAREFILRRFYCFSDEYGDFGRKAFTKNWIDSEPRAGKVGGAYCTSFSSPWESRILCNFDNSFNSVTTMAHELGHAYHHHVLEGTDSLLRDYPMTLAETASIFSENIIYGGLLSELDEKSRLPVLETFLQDSCQVIVDILSRYLFEKAVFEKRREGELSPEDFSTLMIDAQRQTYGDGLDEELLHPYMWAVKGHYYSHERAFYNFPYAFGLLFGLGLYGLYLNEGKAFTRRYRSILQNTGKTSAVEVAQSAGFDIEEPGFWQQGIQVIAGRAEEFSKAAGE